MPGELCLCSTMPSLDLKTRVAIFMHRSEINSLSNSGVFAHRILQRSRLYFRGRKGEVSVPENEFASENAFVLFPHESATEITPEFISSLKTPMTLICPDGHWGQANKMTKREKSLRDLPAIKLPQGLVSSFKLRRNVMPGRVCTFEALTLALGLLEGDEVQQTMSHFFLRFTSRLMWIRGLARFHEIVP
jgi:DTW domain-containing protein YfiP